MLPSGSIINWQNGQLGYFSSWGVRKRQFPVVFPPSNNMDLPENPVYYRLLAKSGSLDDTEFDFFLLRITAFEPLSDPSVFDLKDFSGILEINNKDDEIIFDILYINGVEFGNIPKGSVKYAQPNCYTIRTEHWIDWYNGYTGEYTGSTLESITYQRYCTSEDGGGDSGGTGGGGSLGGTGDGDSYTVVERTELKLELKEGDDLVYEVKNEINDPCAGLVISQLTLISTNGLQDIIDNNPDLESNNFSEAILYMFSGSREFDYILVEDSSLPESVSAITNNEANYNVVTKKWEITTKYNSGYLKDATRLSIARTTIHESIHAFLIYVLKPGVESSNSVRTLLTEYANRKGYPLDDLGRIHHNFMSQFVDSIAFFLYEWDQSFGVGNLSWQYYLDMAWGGLIHDQNGEFWEEFINHNPEKQDQDRIIQRVLDERTNSQNSTGDGEDCQ